jgi:hypothetical protein
MAYEKFFEARELGFLRKDPVLIKILPLNSRTNPFGSLKEPKMKGFPAYRAPGPCPPPGKVLGFSWL